ncbi:hypothetical protein AGMMS50276_01670 [Synergistales bacterium]|nr:hypothetical protein AGMMS50276_01670 [Synergistales bacterium]
MNWMVLILSLGAMIMSVIHGVMALLLSSGGAAQAGSPFTVITGGLLLLSALFALVGGGMAFAKRRFGGFLLLISAAICFLAHADTRVYAYFYVGAGVLAFFCRRKDVYEYYEDDDEDEDDIEEDSNEPEWQKDTEAEDDEEEAPYTKRARARVKTRASRISSGREEYISSRGRSVKTCPHCMTEVDISYKFCNECGRALSVSERIPSERIPSFAAEAEEDSPPPANPVPLVKETPVFAFSPEYESESESERELEYDESETEPPNQHKIFVQPEPDERVIPKMPINIGPDNSYQAFHNYTRRRRNRRYPLARRLAAILILLGAIGGTMWFLLGTNKTPQRELPVTIPAEQPTVVVIPDDEGYDTDSGLAVPSDGGGGGDVLSSLRIETPTRGVVIGNGVNVRSDHSTTSAKVTTMSQGARTDVLNSWPGASGAQSGAWYQIRTNSGNGWIYGQYFQPLDSRATTLPSGYTSALLKTFGSNRSELTTHLGAATRQTPTTLTWQGMTVNIRGDSDITQIQLTSALHVLQNGVAVGITEERLYQSVGYPSEYRSGRLLYLESPNQGMAVQMKNGKIERLTVGNI